MSWTQDMEVTRKEGREGSLGAEGDGKEEMGGRMFTVV